MSQQAFITCHSYRESTLPKIWYYICIDVTMMNRLRILIFIAATSLLAAGCFYDTQDVLYSARQPVPCDTTNITYLKSIVPIISANCNSCHSTKQAEAFGNGIILDTFNSLQEQAANGKLMHDINGDPGYNFMPKNGSKLISCDSAFIQLWVNANTPNN